MTTSLKQKHQNLCLTVAFGEIWNLYHTIQKFLLTCIRSTVSLSLCCGFLVIQKTNDISVSLCMNNRNGGLFIHTVFPLSKILMHLMFPRFIVNHLWLYSKRKTAIESQNLLKIIILLWKYMAFFYKWILYQKTFLCYCLK